MFYSGGLQAGISLAVTEGEAVVCFVRGLSPHGRYDRIGII
jgi:hypothetical protein